MTKAKQGGSDQGLVGAFSFACGGGNNGRFLLDLDSQSGLGLGAMELPQADENLNDVMAAAQLHKDDLLQEFRHLM
jgi:hypothetical protein